MASLAYLRMAFYSTLLFAYFQEHFGLLEMQAFLTSKVNQTVQFQVTHECKLVRGVMTLALNWYIKKLSTDAQGVSIYIFFGGERNHESLTFLCSWIGCA